MAEFVVTTLTDENDSDASVETPGGTGLSLREAITLANASAGEDSIVFDSNLSGTIRIGAGLNAMQIFDAISIDGDNRIVISGDVNGDDITSRGLTDVGASLFGASRLVDNSQIFFFDTIATGYLRGLTLTGGYGTSYGGAIDAYDSDLTIVESSFVGNANSGGRGGGAIYTGGTLTIRDSYFGGNIAVGDDGGGAIISDGATVEIQNTTFFENETRKSTQTDQANGGVISSVNTGDLTLRNVTITGNQSEGGGGAVHSTNNLTVQNSILLGNTSDGAGDEILQVTGDNTISFVGYNLVGSNSGAFDATISANVGNADPTQIFDDTRSFSGNVFGFVFDNGGPVRTVALKGGAGNAALDASGGPNVPTTDARGFGPSDVPGVGPEGGNIRDLGAFEFISPLVVTTLEMGIDENDGVTTLEEAISYANSNLGADVITFDPSLSGVIRLTGTLEIDDDLTIRGNAENRITISGDRNGNDVVNGDGFTMVQASLDANATSLNDNVRLFNVDQNGGVFSNLTIENLDLTGGRADSNGGAIRIGNIVADDPDLTLINTTLYGNSTTGFGNAGAVYLRDGDIYASNSTFGGNRTEGISRSGGAVFSRYGDVTFVDTTLTNNSTIGVSSGGGAIYAYAGNITITRGEVSENAVTGNYASGGAINFRSGLLTLDDVTISQNSAANSGGAIYTLGGTITGSGVTFTGNSSADDGGAIFVSRSGVSLSLTDSSFVQNSTTGPNGSGGAIFVSNSAVANLNRVDFIDNSTVGNSSYGGAIRVQQGAQLNVLNGTFVGNSTADTGALGGAISIYGGVSSLTHVTVTGNSTGDVPGGGIHVGGSATLTLTNSIVLGNENSFFFEGTRQIDIQDAAVVTFAGRNIVGDSAADFDASVSANVRNANAATVFAATQANGTKTAGVAADNGGPGLTVALRSDSANVALDAGTTGVAFDGRILARSVNLNGIANGGTADLGSFEVQDNFIFAPSFTGGAAFTVRENTSFVGQVQATDDKPGVTFAISGGADAGLFSINGSSGALQFRAAPDFEAPRDANRDNNHSLIVRATDSDGMTTTRALSVRVTNVDEASPPPPFGGGGNGGGGPTQGNDLLSGTGGADRILALGGNDNVRGLGGNDTLVGQAGNDTVKGGGGDDVVKGNGGDDRLLGQGGNDRLIGGGGADTLLGNKGDDTLKGGGGADIFTFKRNDGDDRIQGFRQGQDMIEIRNGANSFDQLDFTNQSGGVLIEFARTSIFVQGGNAAQFDADDFLF